MKKFSFTMPSLILYANDLETALGQVSSHISTVARHVASERDLADCKPRFTITDLGDAEDKEIEELDEDPSKHVHFDHAHAKHGPIELDLDPESPQGIAYAKQKDERAKEAEAAKPQEKDLRTDEENLALHSEAEQARLTKKGA